MSSFGTPAIMLRRIDYGDYDLILTLLTLTKGKISVIAKSAKKSTKRFAGILELFSVMDIVCRIGGRSKMPVLQEAELKHPFDQIRQDIIKTAYASYWAELITDWSEERQQQRQLYHLLLFILTQLDTGNIPADVLSILFQLHFMAISGHQPRLVQCSQCRTLLEDIEGHMLKVDLAKGGVVCQRCHPTRKPSITLTKGTIKQLLWLEKENLNKAGRIRFSTQAIKESLDFLEAFVPFHLGKAPRSLGFLRQMRTH